MQIPNAGSVRQAILWARMRLFNCTTMSTRSFLVRKGVKSPKISARKWDSTVCSPINSHMASATHFTDTAQNPREPYLFEFVWH